MIIRRLFYSFAYIFLLGIPAVVLSYFVKEELNLKAVLFVVMVALLVGGLLIFGRLDKIKRINFLSGNIILNQ